MPHSNLQQQINQIHSFVNQNKLSQAEALLKPLKIKYPGVYQIWFLTGVIEKKQQRFELAIKSFKQAIYCNNNDWQLYNHLAICFKYVSNTADAEKYYNKALRLAGSYKHEPLKNLLILHIDNRNYSGALLVAMEYEGIVEDHPVIQKLVADIFRLQENIGNAISLYEKVLTKQPNNTNAHHNLGLSWQIQGKVKQAIPCFEMAHQLEPKNYQSLSSLGDCYVSLGFFAKAEKFYLTALDLAPQQCEVHNNLNELYWQQNNLQDFGQSYEKALGFFPNDDELRSAFADLLGNAAFYERANSVLEDATDKNAKAILTSRAYLCAKCGQIPLSISYVEQVLKLEFDLELALHKVQLEITLNELENAQQSLNQIFKLSSHNQLALALQGTLWRQKGDERYHWLNDYNNLVKVYTLPVPDGYASLEAFLNKLQERLLTLHKFSTAPLKQTLINGSQIPGGLFSKQHPEINQLVKAIQQVIDTYIEDLSSDSEHPFLSRKTASYEFSGSWSVKLNSQGYHVSHVHSKGWISSSFYVHIPEELGEAEGALYFGKSSFGIETNDTVELTLKPKAGMLVLFPSYFWHGTFPFTSSEKEEYRLTSPFDVIPKGN